MSSCWRPSAHSTLGLAKGGAVLRSESRRSRCPAAARDAAHLLSRSTRAARTMAGSAIFVWGNNAFGKLGVGDVTADIAPTVLPVALPSRCVAVAASGRTSAALTESGELFLWGDVCQGATGVLRHAPQRVLMPPRTLIRSVALVRPPRPAAP